MIKKKLGGLKPLTITCTASDCEANLHCFKFHKQKMTVDQKGACRSCGIKLIDWKRVHKLDLSDAEYTVKALKNELIRHHNWHIDIDLRAINHARRKGKTGMRTATENRIRKYVAPANPVRDGRQTPLEGNIIYYAQHATATCCRKCMEYWHNIPLGIELTENQIQYFVNLIMAYINDRLPNLTEAGEYIPPVRNL